MLGLDKPDQGTLQQISTITAAWSAVFVITNAVLFKRRTLNFNNRLVSCLHALVALVLCPAALDWQHPFSGFGQKTSHSQVLAKTTHEPTATPAVLTTTNTVACCAALCHESQLGLFHLRHALLPLH